MPVSGERRSTPGHPERIDDVGSLVAIGAVGRATPGELAARAGQWFTQSCPDGLSSSVTAAELLAREN
jgi:hypothetical protein